MISETLGLIIAVIIFLPALIFSIVMRPVAEGHYQGGASVRTDRVMAKSSAAHTYRQPANLAAIIKTLDIINVDYLRDLITSARTCVEYSDIPRAEPYARMHGAIRRSVHNGQLKLLLTEIQFLTHVLKTNLSPAWVVYAGSAPSHKLGILRSLFPRVKFILVDPHEHLINYPIYNDRVEPESQYDSARADEILYFRTAAGNRFDLRKRPIKIYADGAVKRVLRGQDPMGDSELPNIVEVMQANPHSIYIIEDYMTDDLASRLAALAGERMPLYFISDIRSSTTEGQHPTNADVIWNSAMCYNWLAKMRPTQWMLKFHPPYAKPGETVEFEQHMKQAIADCPLDLSIRDGKWTYLAGKHTFVQAFAGQSSTEARLVGDSLETRDWDMQEYEDRFFYYNNYHRTLGNHREHAEYVDYDAGIDRCGDCAVMCHILAAYMKKFSRRASRESVVNLVRTILRSIGRHLGPILTLHCMSDTVNVLDAIEAIGGTTDGKLGPILIYRQVINAVMADSFRGDYSRRKEPATLQNQIWKLAVQDEIEKVIASFPMSDYVRIMFVDPTPHYIARSIMNTIKVYDIYGPGEEFTLDLEAKIYYIFVDHKAALARILAAIHATQKADHSALAARLLAASVPDECRGISAEEMAIYHAANATMPVDAGWLVPKNRELDTIIDTTMTKYGLTNVVEICTFRRHSYFDYRISGYAPPRRPDNTGYALHCYYGGLTLDLKQEYGRDALILINIRSVSQPLLIATVRHVVKRNPHRQIIVITEWDQLNNHGRLLTDRTCGDPNAHCEETQCGHHLYINVFGMSGY